MKTGAYGAAAFAALACLAFGCFARGAQGAMLDVQALIDAAAERGGGTPKDAAAKIPEKDGAYPEAFMFDRKPLPACGFYVRHADNIVFENVAVAPASPDAREPFVFDDCAGCTVK